MSMPDVVSATHQQQPMSVNQRQNHMQPARIEEEAGIKKGHVNSIANLFSQRINSSEELKKIPVVTRRPSNRRRTQQQLSNPSDLGYTPVGKPTRIQILPKSPLPEEQAVLRENVGRQESEKPRSPHSTKWNSDTNLYESKQQERTPKYVTKKTKYTSKSAVSDDEENSRKPRKQEENKKPNVIKMEEWTVYETLPLDDSSSTLTKQKEREYKEEEQNIKEEREQWERQLKEKDEEEARRKQELMRNREAERKANERRRQEIQELQRMQKQELEEAERLRILRQKEAAAAAAEADRQRRLLEEERRQRQLEDRQRRRQEEEMEQKRRQQAEERNLRQKQNEEQERARRRQLQQEEDDRRWRQEQIERQMQQPVLYSHHEMIGSSESVIGYKRLLNENSSPRKEENYDHEQNHRELDRKRRAEEQRRLRQREEEETAALRKQAEEEERQQLRRRKEAENKRRQEEAEKERERLRIRRQNEEDQRRRKITMEEEEAERELHRRYLLDQQASAANYYPGISTESVKGYRRLLDEAEMPLSNTYKGRDSMQQQEKTKQKRAVVNRSENKTPEVYLREEWTVYETVPAYLRTDEARLESSYKKQREERVQERQNPHESVDDVRMEEWTEYHAVPGEEAERFLKSDNERYGFGDEFLERRQDEGVETRMSTPFKVEEWTEVKPVPISIDENDNPGSRHTFRSPSPPPRVSQFDNWEASLPEVEENPWSFHRDSSQQKHKKSEVTDWRNDKNQVYTGSSDTDLPGYFYYSYENDRKLQQLRNLRNQSDKTIYS